MTKKYFLAFLFIALFSGIYAQKNCYKYYRYDKKSINEHGDLINKIKSGIVEIYNDTAMVKYLHHIINYENYKKNGNNIIFNYDSTILSFGNYKNGKKDGVFIFRNDLLSTGLRYEFYTFNKDKLNGFSGYFDFSGRNSIDTNNHILFHFGNFKNNLKDGIWISFKAIVQDDFVNGVYTSKLGNFEVYSIFEYKEGKLIEQSQKTGFKNKLISEKIRSYKISETMNETEYIKLNDINSVLYFTDNLDTIMYMGIDKFNYILEIQKFFKVEDFKVEMIEKIVDLSSINGTFFIAAKDSFFNAPISKGVLPKRYNIELQNNFGLKFTPLEFSIFGIEKIVK